MERRREGVGNIYIYIYKCIFIRFVDRIVEVAFTRYSILDNKFSNVTRKDFTWWEIFLSDDFDNENSL